MNRFILLALLALAPINNAPAAGVVHIANGDCAGLSTSASAKPGQEPALIVLARNGTYGYCPLTVNGNIAIDGAGASMILGPSPGGAEITIAPTATATIRNLNFGGQPEVSSTKSANLDAVGGPHPGFFVVYGPAIDNKGTLVLDSVSIANAGFGISLEGGGGLIVNSGNLILRNASLAGVSSVLQDFLSGNVHISQSTIQIEEQNAGAVFGYGVISVANSIVMNSGGVICDNTGGPGAAPKFISLGGNLLSDNSCGATAQNDRVVADARFLDLSKHGGTVATLALSSDSPAIANGLAANCEATDARGAARGTASCDSGAYEFGGGAGNLAAAGGSGVYYQSGANNGHYVTVQRLGADYVLVMWSTFDQKGTPAWLYGVGTLSGTTITVPQVAENLGGILHAGGSVTGATPTFWGSMTLNLASCHAAQLDYKSSLPLFGSGSINLQRLVFIDGLDCSQ